MVKWLVCGLLFLVFGVANATQLQQLQLGTQSLDLSLDSMATPKLFRLNNPERIVIDLPNTRLSVYGAKNFQTPTCTVRTSQFTPSITRVVLQSTQKINYQLQTGFQSGHYHIRLSWQSAHLNLVSVSPPVYPNSSIPKYKVQTWRPVGKRNILVVIDPGHGGKDPGASGFHHTLEKHVVLAIAKRLQQKINRQPGMHAVLTRDGDYFIDLRRRLDISRKYHPDVFIAIHADAFTNTHSHGASVFALSQRGATSEAARWLAEKENYSELGGVNLRDLDDQNGMVRSVLIDLSQTATIQAGLKMGQNVLRDLGQITTLHNHHVEQARFVVLKSPDTPSILVETGFISNPMEEQNLSSPSYQEKLSQAIFNGLCRYFREFPPRGTQLR